PMSAMADTTIYGLIDNAVTNGDNSSSSNDSSMDVRQGNGTSRFGVKGREDLGDGLKAIFQYEWATVTAEGGLGSTATGFANRLGYVGLAGSFGKVTVGRQWNPYYFAVGKNDIMNGPTAGYRQSLNHYRTGNGLGYATPNMNGFSAAITLAMDAGGATDIEDGVDQVSLNVKYDNGPLSIGLGYRQTEGTGATSSTGGGTNVAFTSTAATVLPTAATTKVVSYGSTAAVDDSDTWGLGAKYNFGNFAVMASYEDQDNGGAADKTAWGLAGEAYFGNNTVKLSVSSIDTDATSTTASTDTMAWAIGLQHSFSKRTRVYVEYSDLDADTTSDADMDEFAIGLRHDF
ncbi:MAG: porin, partial [Aestuariibacter sp.]|nr:porin [Aestuariibacter sp.]